MPGCTRAGCRVHLGKLRRRAWQANPSKPPGGSISRRDVQGLVSKGSRQQAPRTVSRQYGVFRATFKLRSRQRLPGQLAVTEHEPLERRQRADGETSTRHNWRNWPTLSAKSTARWLTSGPWGFAGRALRVADLDFFSNGHCHHATKAGSAARWSSGCPSQTPARGARARPLP